MIITGKNFKGNVAKGILSLRAFLTIYRIYYVSHLNEMITQNSIYENVDYIL